MGFSEHSGYGAAYGKDHETTGHATRADHDAVQGDAGIPALPTTHEEARADLVGSDLVREVLGSELLGAFVACRDADAAWAAEHSREETIASLRWLY